MKILTPRLKVRYLKNNKTYIYSNSRIREKSKEAEGNPTTKQEFFQDVLAGLSQKSKALPSKYLYDNVGSKIFQEIMNLDEYYLTRAEHQILEMYGNDICSLIHQKCAGDSKINFIELGAGDGQKTSLLLKELCSKKIPFEYVPIDISESAMISLMERLERDFNQIQSEGIISDYLEGINWLRQKRTNFNFVLFLGSNIGNFQEEMTIHFLSKLWEVLNHEDYLLIGFDLKKDIPKLQDAYSDSSGVTDRFNTNLLSRINRELDANFVPEKFQHYATYNPVLGAMESYLISQETQVVEIRAIHHSFSFDEREPIHIEYSFKYTPLEIKELAQKTGFELVRNYYDKENLFTDSLWKVNKRR